MVEFFEALGRPLPVEKVDFSGKFEFEAQKYISTKVEDLFSKTSMFGLPTMSGLCILGRRYKVGVLVVVSG